MLCAALALLLRAAPVHAQWSFEASVERFHWHEDVPPIDVRETGPRFGAGIGYLLPRDRGPLFGLRASVYGGGVDYTGSLQLDRNTVARGTSIYFGVMPGAELRYRWPGAVDAVAGLDADFWHRRLGVSQREDYRVLSGRLGLEHPARGTSRIVVGGGVRWLLAIRERTTITQSGTVLHLQLSPHPGSNAYAEAGYRVAPRWLALVYWDGMQMGRSDPLVIRTGNNSRTTVFQPATEVSTLGLRVVFSP